MKTVVNLILALALVTSVVSCQVKGMYASAKTGGIPVPYNISVMKKSDKDVQAATGPGYTYYSETVNGDETIVPKSAIRWWGMAKVADAMASTAKAASDNLRVTDVTKSNNATAEGIAKINADKELGLAGIAAEGAKQ